MLKPPDAKKKATTHNENGYKARDGGVPVSVRWGFTDENTVEDEITKTQLHSTYINIIYLLPSTYQTASDCLERWVTPK